MISLYEGKFRLDLLFLARILVLKCVFVFEISQDTLRKNVSKKSQLPIKFAAQDCVKIKIQIIRLLYCMYIVYVLMTLYLGNEENIDIFITVVQRNLGYNIYELFTVFIINNEGNCFISLRVHPQYTQLESIQ